MTNDRDAPVDRLLPGTLRARAGTAPGGACLDAETLAAWADGALDARQRAGAEAHAADCARCQALLAAMVRTLPPLSAAKWRWQMPAIGWLVPLTVAATALVIWVAVPKPAPVQQADTVATTVDQVAPAPPSAPSADAKQRVELRSQPPTAPREQQDAAALEKKASPVGANASEATVAPAAKLAADAAAPSAASGAPPAPAAESLARRAAPPALAPRSALANPLDSVIVSSNPATRFRLLPGGGVQRSADGGATWRTEVTGAAETLTAGASPSPSVCWLIGRSGTVLLSTDGRSWRRLAFPETVDLRSVSAIDNETATVTTVDGHAWVTTDGGQTWSRAPGV